MKTKKIFSVLMILPLAAVLIALQFLPDQIPAHYNLTGQVDRWGSKYETLVFPAFTLVFGGAMLATAKYASKQEENGSNNEAVCLMTGVCGLILFNAMTLFFLFLDLRKTEDLTSAPVDLYQLLFGILGVGLIAVGNVLPKLRMNSLIGLRTVWSMKNEETWKKSQRFGGISLILGGLGIVLVSLLAEGFSCVLWSIGILAVLTSIDIFYTCQTAKKE